MGSRKSFMCNPLHILFVVVVYLGGWEFVRAAAALKRVPATSDLGDTEEINVLHLSVENMDLHSISNIEKARTAFCPVLLSCSRFLWSAPS